MIRRHHLFRGSFIVPDPWPPESYFRLFLSHLAPYRSFAGELREAFKRYGIVAFVAHEDIEPTHEWQDMIESALSTMDALVALLHPDFHVSHWCDQEVGIAMGMKKLVLSVRLGADPHGFIGKYQALQGLHKASIQLAEEIANTLAVHQLTSRAMARGTVQVLRDASSYSTAIQVMAFIETIPVADRETADLLEAASQYNSQVASAWGVPKRIATVVQRWRTP